MVSPNWGFGIKVAGHYGYTFGIPNAALEPVQEKYKIGIICVG